MTENPRAPQKFQGPGNEQLTLYTPTLVFNHLYGRLFHLSVSHSLFLSLALSLPLSVCDAHAQRVCDDAHYKHVYYTD